MLNLNKVFAFSIGICCTILSLSACTHENKKDKVFTVNASLPVLTEEEEFLTNKNEIEKVENTETNIVTEKIAMFPEYIFDNVNENMYLLESTILKKIPYDKGEDFKQINQYEKIIITGKNNLKYWKINVEGNDYYIDSSKLTSDIRYVFTECNEVKYASEDLDVKKDPFTESETISNLKMNDEITLVGKNDNEFWKIKINDTYGYINKDLLMSEKNLISQNGSFTVNNQNELETIWAIVMQEAGDNYDGALAVVSSAANRCDSSRWSYNGSTIYQQLTAPGQYCYSIDSHWIKYLGGNVTDNVKQAVADGLNGKRNHNFTCFRSSNGGDTSRVNIGGNWYFGD